MVSQQHAGRGERFVRRYEYDDGWVVAADLGVSDERTSVDVVGRTAIVVVEGPNGGSETEFDLPGAVESVDTNNGVLVIRGQ